MAAGGRSKRRSLAIALLLIFLGESVSILAEVLLASAAAAGAPLYVPFALSFLAIALAGVMLVAGYMTGISVLRNIWAVSVVSIASILIVEPLSDYLVFLQLPTTGALVGFILAACGLLADLLVK